MYDPLVIQTTAARIIRVKAMIDILHTCICQFKNLSFKKGMRIVLITMLSFIKQF